MNERCTIYFFFLELLGVFGGLVHSNGNMRRSECVIMNRAGGFALLRYSIYRLRNTWYANLKKKYIQPSVLGSDILVSRLCISQSAIDERKCLKSKGHPSSLGQQEYGV